GYLQGLQRHVAGPVRLRHRQHPPEPQRGRGAPRQVRPAARPGAHPPLRDHRGGRPHPPGVRRLPDAGGPGGAADRGRRGRGVGLRARPARCALRGRGQAHRPGGGPHVGAAADDRRQLAGARRGRSAGVVRRGAGAGGGQAGRCADPAGPPRVLGPRV
ncbi:MAG: Cystathionine beta-synthase, partial [uncultured Nocardioides sp.]